MVPALSMVNSNGQTGLWNSKSQKTDFKGRDSFPISPWLQKSLSQTIPVKQGLQRPLQAIIGFFFVDNGKGQTDIGLFKNRFHTNPSVCIHIHLRFCSLRKYWVSIMGQMLFSQRWFSTVNILLGCLSPPPHMHMGIAWHRGRTFGIRPTSNSTVSQNRD